MQWAKPPQDRDQMVLFSQRLDDALPPDHIVRLLDDILGRVSWTAWEARYHLQRGQPAVHPRVVAGVLLYGLLTGVRSSRRLEEALIVRLDFRWLAEGRSLDHTTLSEFRRKHAVELKDLFVQLGLIAREMNLLSLQLLAFDGTRLRANNRRRGTRTPEELRKLKQALAEKYAALEAQAAAEDDRDEEQFGLRSSHALPEELADVARRQRQVEAALDELARIEQAEQTVPARLPLTDPQSRVSPNKEGGYAPNYTPLAMVDAESGLIVACDVISATDEEHHLVAAIDQVQADFGLAAPPPEILADGIFATGENLQALAERSVTLYSPVGGADPAANPALRDDPTQPVAEELWNDLPKRKVNVSGRQCEQLDKGAFVYDEERDVYWCPLGQPLAYQGDVVEKRGGRERRRSRYRADAETCGGCPLLEMCLQTKEKKHGKGKAKGRQVYRDEHEGRRAEHARRMATPEAKRKYARRRHPSERPFAMIKQHFGARRFLLRGLDRVRCEWRWLSTAFNLHRLIHLTFRGRAGPEERLAVVPAPT